MADFYFFTGMTTITETFREKRCFSQISCHRRLGARSYYGFDIARASILGTDIRLIEKMAKIYLEGMYDKFIYRKKGHFLT